MIKFQKGPEKFHLYGRCVLVLPVSPWTTIMIDSHLGISAIEEREDCGTCLRAADCPDYEAQLFPLAGMQ